MWNPYDHGEARFQRGSFLQPVIPPTTEICDPPLYCISVNQEWLPYLAGAAMQLAQPSTWDASDTDREIALRRATDLVSEIGNAVPCQPAPYRPPGTTNPQQACNIAGYLAFVVIKQAMLQAVNAIQNDLGIINFGLTLIRLIPGVGWAYIGFAAAISGFLTDIASGSLTDYQNAIGDEALWSQVTCAIYGAILPDGDVTAANFPRVQSALCALTYTPTDVVTAICNWVTNLGAQQILQAQQPGVLAQYNCDCVGDIITGPPALTAGQAAGTVRVLIAAGKAIGQGLVTFATGFATTPVITVGSDDPIMLPSVAAAAPSSTLVVVEAARPVEIDTYVDVNWIALPPGQT